MKRFMVGIMVGLLLGTAIDAFADGYFTAILSGFGTAMEVHIPP